MTAPVNTEACLRPAQPRTRHDAERLMREHDHPIPCEQYWAADLYTRGDSDYDV